MLYITLLFEDYLLKRKSKVCLQTHYENYLNNSLENKSNSRLYKPHFINEFGFDTWLGMSFNNKQEAQECINCVMNHAKVNNPDRCDGFSFYIEEVSI